MEELKLECYQLERSYIKRVVVMASPELHRFVLPLFDGRRIIGFYKKLNRLVQEEIKRPRQEMTPSKRWEQSGVPDLTDIGRPLTKLVKSNTRTIEKLATMKKIISQKFDQLEGVHQDGAGSKTKNTAIKALSETLNKYRQLLDKEAKNRVLIECKVELEERELTKHQRRSFETMFDSLCDLVDSISEHASRKPGGDARVHQTNQLKHTDKAKPKTRAKINHLFKKNKVEPLVSADTLRSQVVDYDIFLAPLIKKDMAVQVATKLVKCVAVGQVLSGWV